GLERLDLLQLHRVDPKVPLAESLGELVSLQREGKIRHLGLSEVSVAQLDAALKITPIVSVQNLFNLTNRSSEALLDHAAKLGVAFIPWFPLATGALAKPGGPLRALAEKHRATPSQLALAWLLRRSPAMLPIPGTSSVQHLEENIAGAEVSLSDAEFEAIGRAV
ncbi:MAG TPA: aldo/keto reductase, partial [Polyangiaceae bacterium]